MNGLVEDCARLYLIIAKITTRVYTEIGNSISKSKLIILFSFFIIFLLSDFPVQEFKSLSLQSILYHKNSVYRVTTPRHKWRGFMDSESPGLNNH